MIKIWIEDENGNTFNLGNCLTDNIQRSLDLYKSDLNKFEEAHQAPAFLCWKFIDG